jgi:hypothetical protein
MMNTRAARIWKRCAAILVLVAVALLENAASACAQETQVAAGISWLWLQGDYARWHTYPGWSFGLARSVTPHVSIAGEANGNYYSPPDWSNGWSESHRSYTIAVGPKLNTSRNSRLIIFAQALAGIEASSSTLHTPPSPDFNGSSVGFVIQPGGGVDVQVARRVALRTGLDVVVVDPWSSISWQLAQWRLRLAAVYGW